MKKIFIVIGLIMTSSVSAETQWKLGAGIGNLTANSYPGSDQTEIIISPIPYFKIKTEWFDLDREGLHTHWFESTRFRFDVSFDLGLPVDSDDVALRKGMPDLSPVGLIGPMLKYQLFESATLKWQLHFPITYAFEIDDLEAYSIGWVSNPRIYLNYLHGDTKLPLDISLSLGPIYGSADYHQFYYAVEQSFVTMNRSAYTTEAGRAGYRFNLSLTKRMNGYWLGLYVRYQDLSEAVFIDSPLVNKKDYWFVALGASWLFAGNL